MYKQEQSDEGTAPSPVLSDSASVSARQMILILGFCTVSSGAQLCIQSEHVNTQAELRRTRRHTAELHEETSPYSPSYFGSGKDLPLSRRDTRRFAWTERACDTGTAFHLNQRSLVPAVDTRP
jgi:hypothetical protein